MNNKITDCNGVPYPEYTRGTVTYCDKLAGAVPEGSVYCLKLLIKGERKPVPGQFYMLHPVKSDNFLARPISVFHAEQKGDSVEVTFLILVKGSGTVELCSLKLNDEIKVLGPLGNIFPRPAPSTGSGTVQKVLIVGGGIGVAPVAGFAESLPEKSYDFVAAFKSGSYGLENLKAENLWITTDDGSCGIKGMVSAALTEDVLKNGNYSAVYACGPSPMLDYVKQVSEKCGVQCWLSMEARMACGMGVCLGCTIETSEGLKRCCKDGPVFDSKILSFPQFQNSFSSKPNRWGSMALRQAQGPQSQAQGNTDWTPDISFDFKGVRFENPLIGSSGTFGFGVEYESVFDVNRLGGISSKGLTLEPRQGNEGTRIWEVPAGVMNSIGLNNPGIPHFIEKELPEMLKLKPVTIANLSGSSVETYVEGAKLLDKTDVPVIELNISCPNVAAGGASFGMTCQSAGAITKEIRAVTSKPLMVKLTPQAPALNEVALACIEAGADGISLCNSFQGVAIDIERGVPVFDKIKAGFGGPAVRPIAVRLVYELCAEIKKLPINKQVPVIAIGGIEKWQDVVEFIMAGASLCQVGSATFANPMAMIECIDGLTAFMKRKGYKDLNEFKGIIL